MLRVGLTGGLGSGKSTVAGMLQHLGAHVFSADEIGRRLMQPGEAVFAAIVQKFGPGVLRPDGTLGAAVGDRGAGVARARGAGSAAGAGAWRFGRVSAFLSSLES